MINRKLVGVERAAADLRRGGMVIIEEGDASMLVTAAELITESRLTQLKDLTQSDPLVGLTYNRANVLKISPRSGDVALVELSEHVNCGVIASMADPADDLINMMQGPFQVSKTPPNSLHEAGIKLCKIAKLLPAAVYSGPLDNAARVAKDHQLIIANVDDILQHSLNDASSLEIVTSAKVPLALSLIHI